MTLQWSNERMPGHSVARRAADRAYALVRVLRRVSFPPLFPPPCSTEALCK